MCVLGGCVFHTQNGIRAGLALKIATDERFRYLDGERDLVGERDEDGMTALQLLSCNPKAFERVRRRGFLKRISSKGKYHKVNIMNTIFLLFSFSAHINGVIFFFIFLVKRFFFFFFNLQKIIFYFIYNISLMSRSSYGRVKLQKLLVLVIPPCPTMSHSSCRVEVTRWEWVFLPCPVLSFFLLAPIALSSFLCSLLGNLGNLDSG